MRPIKVSTRIGELAERRDCFLDGLHALVAARIDVHRVDNVYHGHARDAALESHPSWNGVGDWGDAHCRICFRKSCGNSSSSCTNTGAAHARSSPAARGTRAPLDGGTLGTANGGFARDEELRMPTGGGRTSLCPAGASLVGLGADGARPGPLALRRRGQASRRVYCSLLYVCASLTSLQRGLLWLCRAAEAAERAGQGRTLRMRPWGLPGTRSHRAREASLRRPEGRTVPTKLQGTFVAVGARIMSQTCTRICHVEVHRGA